MRRPGGSELGRPEQEEARRPRAAEAPGIHGRGGDGGEQRGVEVAHGARSLRWRPAAGAEATKVARRRPRAAEQPAMECGRVRPRGARSDLALLYIPCCRAGVRGIRPAALQYGCLVSVNLVAIPYPLVCTFVSLLHSFSFSEMSDK